VASTPSCYCGCALLPGGDPIAVLAPRAMLTYGHVEAVGRLPVTGRHLHVLLVEDSLVTREMERRMLEDEGFLVTAAADGEEALRHLGKQDFDCMVTDVEMPGISGLELTRRVRGIPRLAHLPVIVVSTRDRPEDRTAGMEAGADVYLSKHILESRDLATTVRRLGSRE
jgi:CheY-like chemotaxis protein